MAAMRSWQGIAAVVLVVAAVGAGLVWFLQRDDEDSVSSTTGTTAVPATSAPAPTEPVATEPLPTEPLPTEPVPTEPASTVPPTVPPPNVPVDVPIGSQWVADGQLPFVGFEPVAGTWTYLVDDGYVVEIVLGSLGYEIWLEAVVDATGPSLLVQLVDAVAVEASDLTTFVLALTPCLVDGRATDRVVGSFLFEETAELVNPVQVFEVDPALARLLPIAGVATCQNAGFGG